MAWIERNNGLIYKWWQTGSVDVEGAWQAIGASDEADSYVNLITPGTFDLTVVAGDPGWTKSAGWSFNGSSYFNTGILASENQTIMVLYIDAITSPAERIMGVDDTVTPIDFFIRNFSGDLGGGSLNSQTEFNYGTASKTLTQTTTVGDYIVLGLNKSRVYHSGNNSPVQENSFAGWSDTALTHYIGATNGNITNNWTNNILAVAIYNQILTASEMTIVAGAMLQLTSAHDPRPNANYIVQHPATKRLNNTSHELLIATDNGIYRTFNGGREWAQITLPDPSNTEFSDSPAATVDELVFDWVAYDPLDSTIIYARGTKASVSRMWIYKSTDDGLNWSSRGVVAT